jgi:hypothetical protein
MAEVGERTPLREAIVIAYDETKERIRYGHWKKTSRGSVAPSSTECSR